MAHEAGQPEIVWNHFRDLNHIQLSRFSVAPQMIHQYRQRIARTWRADTGRQPQVRVISYVMLNYKYPQPLVDPVVDLGSISYRVFRHNDWILPLSAERLASLRDSDERSPQR